MALYHYDGTNAANWFCPSHQSIFRQEATAYYVSSACTAAVRGCCCSGYYENGKTETAACMKLKTNSEGQFKLMLLLPS